MRIFIFFSLIATLALSSPVRANPILCATDLDAKRLTEIAELTVQYEVSQRRDDAVQRMTTQQIYQTAYTEITRGLDPAQIEILDIQIKEEIERIQRRAEVEARVNTKKEKTVRRAEEELLYGSHFLLFEKLALQSGNSRKDFRALFDLQTLQSFRYRPYTFPKDGKVVTLGSPEDEPDRETDEKQYEVTLTRSFEMQATPVTQLQWSLVMKENPSAFNSGGKTLKINGRDVAMNPNRPVEQVSWEDVQTFILKLNDLDAQFHYRLPTEAEWEYAARAGTYTIYSFGDDVAALGEYAWYKKNSGNQTHDVAGLKPNAGGLYDMYGNVTEWVQDWYGHSRPPNAKDPVGRDFGTRRMFRGGSWYYIATYSRSAKRTHAMPDFRYSFTGFRLVRNLK